MKRGWRDSGPPGFRRCRAGGGTLSGLAVGEARGSGQSRRSLPPVRWPQPPQIGVRGPWGSSRLVAIRWADDVGRCVERVDPIIVVSAGSVVEGASGGEGGAANALLRGAGPRPRGVPCRVVVSARIRPRVRARVRSPGAEARAGTRAVRPRTCGHGPTDIGHDAVRESGSRRAVASRGLAVHRAGHLWLRRGDRRDGGGRGGRGVARARGGVGGS